MFRRPRLAPTTINISVNNKALLESERWFQVREHVYRRDGGRCVICSRPGTDCHHWVYNCGYFNPLFISLLCRNCHLAWRGRDPDHLDDGNQFKPLLSRLAEIARGLGLKPE